MNQTVKSTKRSVVNGFFRSKKKIIRSGLITVNAVLLVGVAGFILSTRSTQSGVESTIFSSAAAEKTPNPLDTISSADIAVNIAQLARLDETTAVANNADSINAQLRIVPTDSQVVAKPQIVSTDAKSVIDIRTYVAVSGDTITSIAEKFSISKNAIRWSNDLTGDAVRVGSEVLIPPVEGIIYTVKEDDTIESIAKEYSASVEEITTFNDAELNGITKDQQIVIPEGEISTLVARAQSGPAVSGFRFGTSAIYGFNGYDKGYCTWHASSRRAAVGKPIPANLGNASTWKVRAQLAGIPTGNVPKKHAVIWTPPRDYYGHVGFVEEVYPDGSVLVSEMNVRGWNVLTEKVLSPAQAAGFFYIY